MSILNLVYLGTPVLNSKSKEVSEKEIKSKSFQNFLDDLSQTLTQNEIGAGLAAPQVNKSLSVFAIKYLPKVYKNDFKISINNRPLEEEVSNLSDKDNDIILIINPKIKVLDSKLIYGPEGCLSLPNLICIIGRYLKIQLDFLDREGNKCQIIANDWPARLLQHENDHLNGKIMLDMVKSSKDVYTQEVYKQMTKKK